VIISENEEKIRQMLMQVMGKEGYEASVASKTIQLIRKDSVKDVVSLENKVIELQDELFNEKKGELYKSIVDRIERVLIGHVLEKTEGNQLKAARILGINRNTIRTKIRRLGINVSQWKTAQ
jgi:DNA-binding protein Fis